MAEKNDKEDDNGFPTQPQTEDAGPPEEVESDEEDGNGFATEPSK
jgi:hypothetical protein